MADRSDAADPTNGSLPFVPILSGGERSTTRTTVVDGIGGPVAELARAPRLRAREAIETARGDGFDRLRTTPIREHLDRITAAGAAFRGIGSPAARADLPPFAVYRDRVVRATGLPAGVVETSAHWLAFGLRHAAEALRAQSPTGGLDVYDDPAYTRETTVGLAFAPRARVLGASMPANDPAVYGWPALALAMAVPIVVRPSDREPFTALRLVRALRAAGVPPDAVHFLPADRGVGETIIREADRGMAFGDAPAVASYRDNPTVAAYGPGESAAIVASDLGSAALDSLARGIVRSGGRACFNLTRVVATRDCDPDRLADALAARIADAPAGSPFDTATDAPAFPDAERARRLDARVEALGTDVTARHRDGPRLLGPGGANGESDGDNGDASGRANDCGDGASSPSRLRPTVLRTDDLVPELPFPFAGVTFRPAGALPDCLGGAYLGVVVGAPEVERAAVRSPSIRKVYGGRYPASVDLRETHETYLAAELYETTTYDPGPRDGRGQGHGPDHTRGSGSG